MGHIKKVVAKKVEFWGWEVHMIRRVRYEKGCLKTTGCRGRRKHRDRCRCLHGKLASGQNGAWPYFMHWAAHRGFVYLWIGGHRSLNALTARVVCSNLKPQWVCFLEGIIPCSGNHIWLDFQSERIYLDEFKTGAVFFVLLNLLAFSKQI